MNNIDRLQELFKRFPGIGPKQAERFVYFLLRSGSVYKQDLAKTILSINNEVKLCESCGRFFLPSGESNYCKICADPTRDLDKLLIVEKEKDIDKIEASGAYSGMYYVAKGSISPLHDAKKHKQYLHTIKEKARKQDGLSELILAFSATFEGEYSARFIKEEFEKDEELKTIKVSLLGRGLSTGLEIEYSDPETLKYALKNRF